MALDPNSFSNIGEVLVKSFHLELTPDFTQNTLKGFVDLNCEVQTASDRLVLDTRALHIGQISINGKQLEHKLAESNEQLGTALQIQLDQQYTEGTSLTVRVHYETTKESQAIQWLEPSQTAGKQYPYLFTQCQAIHARSLFPTQDTPSAKASYTAKITCQAPLVALMSAVQTGKETNGDSIVYSFEQKIPIPSYLVAIAVGNLKSKEIGPRSNVWCEEETLAASANEFIETEKFIAAAESFLIPYVWGRYDLLVLPPSFPYGGMENPCLTFVTPTLLAGDRSLANVVAHEIAHSWSGNLVTNKHWSDFWLNEGFTVYIERAICKRIYGEDYFDFDAMLGYHALTDSVRLHGECHNFTALIPKLDGIDPDDAFSSVPYEKGFNFLYYLAKLVGGHSVFEPFLKAYFDHFKYQSITSADMKSFFLEYFTGKVDQAKLDSIEWDAWFYTPGMPLVKNEFEKKLTEQAIQYADRWLNHNGEGCESDDIKSWHSRQIVFFLEQLVELTAQRGGGLTHPTLEKMDALFGFGKSNNSEIKFRWQTLCLQSKYTEIIPSVEQFLASQGRMKFVRPLYRELNKVDSAQAVKVFQQYRSSYHNIAAKMIAKDLGLN